MFFPRGLCKVRLIHPNVLVAPRFVKEYFWPRVMKNFHTFDTMIGALEIQSGAADHAFNTVMQIRWRFDGCKFGGCCAHSLRRCSRSGWPTALDIYIYIYIDSQTYEDTANVRSPQDWQNNCFAGVYHPRHLRLRVACSRLSQGWGPSSPMLVRLGAPYVPYLTGLDPEQPHAFQPWSPNSPMLVRPGARAVPCLSGLGSERSHACPGWSPMRSMSVRPGARTVPRLSGQSHAFPAWSTGGPMFVRAGARAIPCLPGLEPEQYHACPA